MKKLVVGIGVFVLCLGLLVQPAMAVQQPQRRYKDTTDFARAQEEMWQTTDQTGARWLYAKASLISRRSPEHHNNYYFGTVRIRLTVKWPGLNSLTYSAWRSNTTNASYTVKSPVCWYQITLLEPKTSTNFSYSWIDGTERGAYLSEHTWKFYAQLQ